MSCYFRKLKFDGNCCMYIDSVIKRDCFRLFFLPSSFLLSLLIYFPQCSPGSHLKSLPNALRQGKMSMHPTKRGCRNVGNTTFRCLYLLLSFIINLSFLTLSIPRFIQTELDLSHSSLAFSRTTRRTPAIKISSCICIQKPRCWREKEQNLSTCVLPILNPIKNIHNELQFFLYCFSYKRTPGSPHSIHLFITCSCLCWLTN